VGRRVADPGMQLMGSQPRPHSPPVR
jgi:hypothetical protein